MTADSFSTLNVIALRIDDAQEAERLGPRVGELMRLERRDVDRVAEADLVPGAVESDLTRAKHHDDDLLVAVIFAGAEAARRYLEVANLKTRLVAGRPGEDGANHPAVMRRHCLSWPT